MESTVVGTSHFSFFSVISRSTWFQQDRTSAHSHSHRRRGDEGRSERGRGHYYFYHHHLENNLFPTLELPLYRTEACWRRALGRNDTGTLTESTTFLPLFSTLAIPDSLKASMPCSFIRSLLSSEETGCSHLYGSRCADQANTHFSLYSRPSRVLLCSFFMAEWRWRVCALTIQPGFITTSTRDHLCCGRGEIVFSSLSGKKVVVSNLSLCMPSFFCRMSRIRTKTHFHNSTLLARWHFYFYWVMLASLPKTHDYKWLATFRLFYTFQNILFVIFCTKCKIIQLGDDG